MSTPLPTSSFGAPGATASKPSPASATAPRPRMAWWREPLLHFLLAGGLLFAIDHVIASHRDDPRTIVIGPEVERHARELFKGSRGREPNAAELKALRQTWLDNEVLYREGVAMQMDRGDDAIRERVIFKALSMVDANVKPPKVDDTGLRDWFEAHRAQYDEPARYDFQEAVIAGESSGAAGGAASEATVKAFVERLDKGTPGELEAGLRVFKGRPHQNIVDSYGDDFARALEAAPAGRWRAYATKDGWRAMRLEASVPGKAADFASLRGVVYHDWIDAVMAEQRTQAVRALAAKYKVVQADAAEAAGAAR